MERRTPSNLVGISDQTTSLRNIMGLCSDFINEEGMLQHLGRNIGVIVMLTPKCIAEMAGKGIEYMWACSKAYYRGLTLCQQGEEKKIQ